MDCFSTTPRIEHWTGDHTENMGLVLFMWPFTADLPAQFTLAIPNGPKIMPRDFHVLHRWLKGGGIEPGFAEVLAATSGILSQGPPRVWTG